LDEIMREGVEDPEELVEGVLLKGKVHHLYADAGSGKSWTALGLASKVMEQGKTVVYLDKENGPRTMTDRLNLLGVEPEKVKKLFIYHSDPSTSADEGIRQAYEEMLDQDEPDLIVVDSWIGFLSDADLNENDSSDIQKWARWYLQPARRRGITVLVLDHVPHGAIRSRGSGRKKEEVDVQWELHRSESFDRGTVGLVNLRRKKDREGWLPSKVAFRMGGGNDGFVFERLRSFGEDPRGKLPENQQKILRVLKDKFDGHVPTDAEWKKGCEEYEEVASSSYYDAKKKLLEKKFIGAKGKGFVYLEPGAVDDDE
ncbi:MAG: AAA family ATPase, partial [Actinomycetota bacterium]|nr:AAA family ATPase [Actinomycetota bacterium]